MFVYVFDDLGEVRGFNVVDHQVGTKFADPVDLARMGRDDQLAVRRERLAELNRRSVDATAAAVEDRGLAVLEVADHEDVEKRGDVGLADAGRLFEADAFRDAHQVVGVGHGVLGITATADQADDPVTDLPPVNVRPDFRDRS